jgi:glutathione S-transferase
MILIGQYDSPFVRRVAIALRRCAVPFEHRPWSVWADAERLAEYNPLRRVPTLVLDDGATLVETFVILSVIDELVGPGRALLPASGPVRRDGLRLAALAAGVADKAVTLLYGSLELVRPTQRWIDRCSKQVNETLGVLDAELRARTTPFCLGDSISHADIALATSLRFTNEAHPGLVDADAFPALTAHAARCEALAEFREIYLPITNRLSKT